MTFKTRLFIVLWLAGFAGILSLLLLDFDALVRLVPVAEGEEVPTIGPLLKVVSLIQPSVLVAVAVLVGIGLAPKVGLSAPVAEALAAKESVAPRLVRLILPGLIGGVVGGIAIVAIASAFVPSLPPGAADRISEFTNVMPLATRVLSGGITEEILLRWGLMTLIVWVLWRVLQKGVGPPKAIHFVAAILISSLLFAAGHLPVAYMLFPQPTPALVLFVMAANSAFGLIAGYLYWRRGLEAGMIAHILAHIIMYTASRFEMYF
jgi:Type II CAAX prenyl endopeptidase Rce1-like